MDTVTEALGAALQADIGRAVELLRPLDARRLSPEDVEFRRAVLERFDRSSPSIQDLSKGDGFLARLVQLYREYWFRALHAPQEREAESQGLLETFTAELRLDAGDFDAVEAEIVARVEADGAHVILGVTPPLRELLLWRRQESRAFDVALPEEQHTTRVEILDDFLSTGWAAYATCGRRGVGGWATEDALYVVLPRYRSLETEEFRYSFLGHETQHLADRNRYSGLEPWELEYRAKLAELAMAEQSTPGILQRFIEDQSSDPTFPHSYANRRVLAELGADLATRDLRAVESTALRKAAASRLAADSAGRSQM